VKSALLTALATTVIVLAALFAGSTRAALATPTGSSSNVALVPGLHAPKYSPTESLPAFPASQLPGYNFGAVALGSVTAANLSAYDTVILYGIRWSDLSGSEQGVLNEFAKTGKVIIWDADSTGAQDYASFVHPFSTASSGATGGSYGAVASFPSTSPLASSDPASPTYLDPAALVASTHLIGHMNVLVPGSSDWSPGLIAANKKIPGGGWVVAWGYGSTIDHSGMVIYSGIDADAFTDAVSPNYAVKELSIQLAAPFSRTSDSCSPNCSPPPPPPSGGSSGGSGGSGGTPGAGSTGIGAPQTPTFAQCAFARKTTTAWVRGTITLSLRTSLASGIHGAVTNNRNKVVGRGVAGSLGHLVLKVDTRRLPSNRSSALKVNVFVNAASACSLTTSLRVDNAKPKALAVKTTKSAHKSTLRFRSAEPLRFWVIARGHRYGAYTAKHAGTVIVKLPAGLHRATLLLIDRAGNSSHQSVSWK
jgi:hypothetical protein